MDPPKDEPTPVNPDLVKPEPKAEPTEAAPLNETPTRGRGRGRARGRGRRVVPRQVARRKPRPGQAVPVIDLDGDGSAERRRGRGRGRGERGRGGDRGRGQQRGVVPASSNVIGFGEIAPVRASVSRVPSSGGSIATSKRSSAVSSASVGAGSSQGSFGRHGMSSGSDAIGGAAAMEGMTDDLADEEHKMRGRAAKVEMSGPVFMEHVEKEADSDDNMADDQFELRNRDIAPYAGHVTDEGLLLPVSLPGLRSLPPQFAQFEQQTVEKPLNENGAAQEKPEAIPISAKNEPMEIDTAPTDDDGSLHARMFPKDSVAYCLLANPSSLSFLQLPGLLPLEQTKSKVAKGSSKSGKTYNAERGRGLGVDLRSVGNPDTTLPLGKLRFYRSGRVQMIMENGGALDLEKGLTPKVSQQVVLMDSKGKTCHELQNTIPHRFVATPDIDDG